MVQKIVYEMAYACFSSHVPSPKSLIQSRLQENIKSMENVTSSKSIDRYLVDMGKEEDDLIATTQAITALEEQAAALRAEIKSLDTVVEVYVKSLLEQ